MFKLGFYKIAYTVTVQHLLLAKYAMTSKNILDHIKKT